jgi:hypothetical protein
MTIIWSLDPQIVASAMLADHLIEAGLALILIRRWRARRARS